MSKTLVLAEKPSVARDIARVLGVRGASGSTADGFMESDDWIVTWALGHLVALSEPDAIDPRYKAWRMDTLPMLPDDIPLRVIEKTKKQFGVVKKLMHRRGPDSMRHRLRARGRINLPIYIQAGRVQKAVLAAVDFVDDRRGHQRRFCAPQAGFGL